MDILILIVLGVCFVVMVVMLIMYSHYTERGTRRRVTKWDISALDLSKIHNQLKRREGWEDVRIAAADAEYRKFLWLLAAYPGEMMVPWSDDLDSFWHQHILNTADYTATCNRLFGKYINHTPEDATNAAAQHHAAHQTNERYRREFDKGRPNGTTTQDSGCSSSVYAACGSFGDGGGGDSGGHSCGSGCGGSSCGGGGGCGGGGCGS